MLMNKNAAEKAAEILVGSDFYRPSLGVAFDTAVKLMMKGEPVDAVTMCAQLDKDGLMDKAGGKERIHELIALVPAASNVEYHAKIVKSFAITRALALAGEKIAKLARDGQGDIEELLALAEAEILTATQQSASSLATPITDGQEEQLAEIREAIKTGNPIFGMRTGFTALDNALQGLWPGQFIIIAARTGRGKTTLAQNVAENVADRELPVLFVSLEMSRKELRSRSWARAAKIDGKKIQTGMIDKEEMARLGAALKIVNERKAYLLVQDDGRASVAKVRAEASRIKRERGLALVVVDYIQLMEAPGDTKNEIVSNISRGLKLLAQQLDVPVIALSQMNRATDGRADKRPMLSDLRDSGSLEQDADVVCFLHDESDYTDQEGDGSVLAIIAKNRRGSTGEVSMLFTRRLTTFLDPPLRPVR